MIKLYKFPTLILLLIGITNSILTKELNPEYHKKMERALIRAGINPENIEIANLESIFYFRGIKCSRNIDKKWFLKKNNIQINEKKINLIWNNDKIFHQIAYLYKHRRTKIRNQAIAFFGSLIGSYFLLKNTVFRKFVYHKPEEIFLNCCISATIGAITALIIDAIYQNKAYKYGLEATKNL